jgi:DNA-binding IclR family transcriptional regulator
MDPSAAVRYIQSMLPGQPAEVHRIMNELNEVRTTGIAYNRGESVPDVYAVASGIRETSGVVVAAVSVAGPLERVRSARSDVVSCVSETTKRIGEDLQYRANNSK